MIGMVVLALPMYWYCKKNSGMTAGERENFRLQSADLNSDDLLSYTPFKFPHPGKEQGNRDSVTSWGTYNPERDRYSFASVVDPQDCGCSGRTNASNKL